MYQGAQATQRGAGRRSNAKRGGSSRRRSTSRKKNPSTVTWILIAGASAAAVGGGIAFAVYNRKKKQAMLPGNGNGELPSGGNGKKPSGGGGKKPSGGKQNAPTFPYTPAEAQAVEASWAVAVTASAVDPATGRVTKSVNTLSDEAFYEMYGISKIPAKSKQGSGWQPYIDSWLRIRDMVEDQVATYGGANS